MTRQRSATLGGFVLVIVMALVAVGVARLGNASPLSAPERLTSGALGAPEAPLATAPAAPSGVREAQGVPAFQSAIRAVAPTVVTLTTAAISNGGFFGPQVERGSGSGVIIDPSGYVLTNAHVVGAEPGNVPPGGQTQIGVDRLDVGLPDGTLYQGQVIGLDPLTDLAVVKILSDRQFPAATLGDSDLVEVGDWVIAIGQPFEFPQTVTAGIVSALAREGFGGPARIQTDAAINQGNSGGPLINLRGEVVAINEMIYSPTQTYLGLSFAIPVNAQTKRLVAMMREGKPIQRGYLGIINGPVGEAVRKVYGVTGGTMVTGVQPDGPADAAGLLPLDVITAANGAPVRGPSDLTKALEQATPGAPLGLTIVRRVGNVFQTLERSVRVGTGGIVQVRTPEPSHLPGLLGIDAQELRPELKVLTSNNQRVGVGVYQVDPLGVGGLAGLRVTDFILAINGEPTGSVDDYNRIMGRLKPGDAVVLYVRRWRGGGVGGQSRDIVIEVPSIGNSPTRS